MTICYFIKLNEDLSVLAYVYESATAYTRKRLIWSSISTIHTHKVSIYYFIKLNEDLSVLAHVYEGDMICIN